jgi:hypothetical protein
MMNIIANLLDTAAGQGPHHAAHAQSSDDGRPIGQPLACDARTSVEYTLPVNLHAVIAAGAGHRLRSNVVVAAVF